MSRDEFIRLCLSMGYCTKTTAEKYAGDRENFTDEDFVEVYRLQEHADFMKYREAAVDQVRGYTTKRYRKDDNGGRYEQ